MDSSINDKMLKVWNEQRYELLDEVYARDYQSRTPSFFGEGVDGIRNQVEAFHKAFPDGHWQTPEFAMEGHTIWVRIVGEGTHTGEFMGMPPTNKYVCMGGVVISHVEHGKVTESWSYFDTAGLMQQLGVQMPGMQSMGGEGMRRVA